MKPVHIPRSPLGQQLEEAERLKAELTKLLGQLEQRYAGRAVTAKPGGWRHDPLAWQKRHRS
jgi:hypothetical protein